MLVLRLLHLARLGTEFDSIIQYQNVDEHPEARILNTSGRLDGFEYDAQPIEYHAIGVRATPKGVYLQLELVAADSCLDDSTAAAILDELCANMLNF
jgi:hypothetical protein